MAGVKVTPEQAAQKWVNRIQQATTEMTNGVNRVNVSPGQLAAAKTDKYLQGVQSNVQKWKVNVGSVTLQSWQQAMINKGIPRVGQGAAASQGKMDTFFARFFTHLEAGQRLIENMPDTTLEQRIQRAVAMMQHNAKFSNSASGGMARP